MMAQKNSNTVVTRFAPSPTGDLHIGGLRQALFAYAFAKHNNGKFILRLEDTDRARFVKGSGSSLMQLLQEFNLTPDLKPDSQQIARMEKGEFVGRLNDWALHLEELKDVTPEDFKNVFVQTQRLPLYQKFAWELIKKGYAYFCFCSPERLQKVNKERMKQGLQPGYDGYCKKHYTLEHALEKIQKGESYVVRMDTNKAKELFGSWEITVQDEILGEIKFDFRHVNDQVLLKSNGIPTYHLAVVVDDYLMGVTHMMRGYEWISSTPKQVFLYKALGWEMPKFVHLPIILDPSGGKLSKRKGSVSVIDFLKQGYIKDALLNFLMLLGWAPDKGDTREFFTLEEFIELFELKRLNKASPVLSREKLLWFNSQYARRKSLKDFALEFKHWLQHYYDPGTSDNKKLKEFILGDKDLEPRLELTKERIKLFTDVLNLLRFFYIEPELVDYRNVKGVKRYDSVVLAKALREYTQKHVDLTSNKDKWVATIREIADKYEIKHADMFMLIRLATVGSPVSVPLYEAFVLMEQGKLLKRLEKYINYLDSLQ